MKDILQLIKKENNQEYKDIYPKTYTDAVLDKHTGANLADILNSFNMYFIAYAGSKEVTRVLVPTNLRRKGLWITYIMLDDTIVTEYYNGSLLTDDAWLDSTNWVNSMQPFDKSSKKNMTCRFDGFTDKSTSSKLMTVKQGGEIVFSTTDNRFYYLHRDVLYAYWEVKGKPSNTEFQYKDFVYTDKLFLCKDRAYVMYNGTLVDIARFTIDKELSLTSNNPIANSTVTKKINEVNADATTALTLARELKEEGRFYINGNVTNNPDEEDITVEENKLKFKNKNYNAGEFSGLGRVYLRKNIVNGKNVLTQEMINKPNTIYIIQYDYDLDNEEINIPENCTLDFQGGLLSNGILNGNNTNIKNIIKFNKIELKNTWEVKTINCKWFGIEADKKIDYSENIKYAIKSCENIGTSFQFNIGKYYIYNPIIINSRICVEGVANFQIYYDIKPNKTILINISNNSPTIEVNDGSQVKIQNIEFHGCENRTDRTTIGILYNNKASRCDLYNIVFKYFDKCIYVKLNSGFSGCNFNFVKCLFNNYGIYIDSLKNENEYLYNTWCTSCKFERIDITDVKYKAIFIQTTWLLDSLNISNSVFANIGYGKDSFTEGLINTELYGIDCRCIEGGTNKNEVGLIRFENCYFENTYYSLGKNENKVYIDTYNYNNNSAINLYNVNIVINTAILANVGHFVKCNSLCNIYISNISDNGVYSGKNDENIFKLILFENTEKNINLNVINWFAKTSKRDICPYYWINSIDTIYIINCALNKNRFKDIIFKKDANAVYYNNINFFVDSVEDNTKNSGLLNVKPNSINFILNNFKTFIYYINSITLNYTKDIIQDSKITIEHFINVTINLNNFKHISNLNYCYIIGNYVYNLKVLRGTFEIKNDTKSSIINDISNICDLNINCENLNVIYNNNNNNNAIILNISDNEVNYKYNLYKIVNKTNKVTYPNNKCYAVSNNSNKNLIINYIEDCVDILNFDYYKHGCITNKELTFRKNKIGYVVYNNENNILKMWVGDKFINIGEQQILKKGTTAQRPTGVQIGFTYKDTDLNKWIIWNGEAWENIDGTALG